MNKSPKMKRLLWIIDFFNLEIDKLRSGDFMKLLYEVSENFPREAPFEHARMNEVEKELQREIMEMQRLEPVSSEEEKKEYEEKPSGLINDFFGNHPPPTPREIASFERLQARFSFGDTPFWRKAVKSLQLRIKTLIEKILEAKDKEMEEGQVENILNLKMSHFFFMKNGDLMVIRSIRKFDLEYKILEFIYTCSPPGKIGFGVDYSLRNLKRCQVPECGKVFWQVHKKEKNYCSNRCAWVAYSRFRREEEKKDRAKRRKEV
jgi:hypothetical protein